MKMHTEAEKIEAVGLGETNNFTMLMNANMFSITIDKLYAEKHLAVVREISANAADANTMVGKEPWDIKVGMPTRLSPEFFVRDYGPGLSKEAMLKNYTTIGLSDKANDNNKVGGFGLGCKCPFAVAETFTVISWHGGQKITYVAYKENGLPKLSVVSTEASDEPTGLRVAVPVIRADLDKWERAARLVFAGWPTIPSGVAHIVSLAKVIAKSSQVNKWGQPLWQIEEGREDFFGPAVVEMGFIRYPVPHSKFVLRDPAQGLASVVSTSNYYNYNDSKTVVFRVDIGDVAPVPSREGLEYTASTLATLQKINSEAAKEFINQLCSQVSDAPSYVDACLTYANLAYKYRHWGNLFINFPNTQSWRGRSITTTPTFWEADFYSTVGNNINIKKIVTSLSRRVWGQPRRERYVAKIDHNFFNSEALAAPKGHRVSLCDFNAGFNAPKYIYFTSTEDEKLALEKPDIYLSGPNAPRVKYDTNLYFFGGATKKNFEAWLKEWAACPELRVIDLDAEPVPPPKPKPVRSKSSAAPAKGYQFVLGSGSRSGSWQRETTAIDLTTPGYYISFYDGDPFYDSAPPEISTKAELDFLTGWFSTQVIHKRPIAGFTQTQLKVNSFVSRLENAGWTRLNWKLFSALTPQDTEVVVNAYSYNFSREVLGSHLNLFQIPNFPVKQVSLLDLYRMLASLPNLPKDLAAPPIVNWMKRQKDFVALPSTLKPYIPFDLFPRIREGGADNQELIKKFNDIDQQEAAVKNALIAFINKYPLVALLKSDSNMQSLVTQISKYIEIVDKFNSHNSQGA